MLFHPLRGGAWHNDADTLRSAYRNRNHADNRNDNMGFRLAAAPANTLLATTRDIVQEPTGRPL